jgi:hypothetical protein
MRRTALLFPLLLALGACDATYVSGSSQPGMVAATPPTDPAAQPDFAMARRACGQTLAGPQGLMRLEFERAAPGGALIMLHVRRDPASEVSQRWRCYFDYTTRSIRAFPAG